MLGLIGSTNSLIGSAARCDVTGQGFVYYTLRFLARAINDPPILEGKVAKRDLPYYSFREATEVALKSIPEAASKLQFVAKVMYTESDIVVGTPVYVAAVP